MPIIGTETEYGILAPEQPGADADLLAAAVVDAYAGAGTPSLADTHNRVLGNGARFYVDHGHPEYSAPETTNATDATLHDLAGDLVVARAAAAAAERLGLRISVFKNNTDGKGNSYGYHENYLLSRALDWGEVVDLLPTYLVSRVVLTGSGRVGIGPLGELPGFQLSARADFFERVFGLDTTSNRGIVNTRDEPHARPSLWRRLHVIAGDANRNPFATWLKIGTAALVLAALQEGFAPTRRLADPVGAFRAVSRDLSLRRPLALADSSTATAVELQRDHLDACARYANRHEFPEADDLLAEWAAALDDLARDPASAADRLDWPAKLGVLQALRARDGLEWSAPRLAQVDLAWADLDAAASPFSALLRSGRLVDWLDPRDVEAAAVTPPSDTRAFARGHLVADHADRIIAATWDSVHVRTTNGVLHNLRMTDPRGHAAGAYDVGATLDGLCERWAEADRADR